MILTHCAVPSQACGPACDLIFSMATIARLPLEIGDADPWLRIARQAQAWATEQGIEIRDAVMLVPFAQHLPLARRAWSLLDGWMPRVETTMTLARFLVPALAG